MKVENGFTVNFKRTELREVLGFDNKIVPSGIHEGEHIIKNMAVTSIFISINIAYGSYVNRERRPVIYSFFPDVSPSLKIIKEPRNLVYFPVPSNTIHDIIISITDQHFKPLNFRGEEITLSFH